MMDPIGQRRQFLRRAACFAAGLEAFSAAVCDAQPREGASAAKPASVAAQGPRNGQPAEPIALVGGTVHPVAGPAIPNATLVIARGRIVAIGPQPEWPAGTRIVDITDRHVYPGLFDASTNLGLSEVGSLPETIDETEFGEITPPCAGTGRVQLGESFDSLGASQRRLGRVDRSVRVVDLWPIRHRAIGWPNQG